MLNLITKTDFVGFLNIDFKQSNDDFAIYSAQLEKSVMTDLFGVDMYNDMLTNPNEDYQYLIDNYLTSLMQYYFFYYYKLDTESYSTTIGEFEANAENASKNVGMRNAKAVKAWNDGTEYYVACANYVYDNKDKYPLYDGSKAKELTNVYGIQANTTYYSGVPFDHSDWFIKGYK